MKKRTTRTSSQKKLHQPANRESVKSLEQHVVEIAEQLGRLAGSAQAEADNWLDQPNLKQQLTRIRDRAASLLERFAAARAMPEDDSQTAAKPRSGGRVDAPGKKHRKAPPAV